MTDEQKSKIETIAKEFASGFQCTIGSINGSGPLIVDPLSGYLDFVGYPNEVSQMPATDQHPQVLLLQFPDGDTFIPAGGDLKPLNQAFRNWMWM